MATDASRMTPDRSRLWRSVVVIGLCLILWVVPPVGPLKPQAMHLIAIFAATILGLILQPLPMGAIVIGALALTTITGTLPVKDAMSGFSEALVWLIVSAFMFSRGFIKTGLGRRIAFLLVRAFGTSTLGLGYALTISDTIIAPATPSNTARAGGILFPIVRSLAASLGSEPGSARERVGAFLMFNEFQTTLMTSAIFLTGTAGNAMVVKLAKDAFKYEITWMGWLWASLVPGLVALLVVPYVIFLLTKPEVKRSPDAAAMATRELEKMGPMARSEKNMLAVFLLTLTLWATGQWTGFDATAVALVGVAVLLASRVLTWDDVLTERGGWDALIWFGGFVSLAGGLSSLKIITYLADVLKRRRGGRSLLGSRLPAGGDRLQVLPLPPQLGDGPCPRVLRPHGAGRRGSGGAAPSRHVLSRLHELPVLCDDSLQHGSVPDLLQRRLHLAGGLVEKRLHH